MRARILSTKKLSEDVWQKGIDCGLEIKEREMIQVRPILTEEKRREVLGILNKKPSAAIVFTSAKAVWAVIQLLRDSRHLLEREMYTMSGKTREAIEGALDQVHIAGTAQKSEELGDRIVENGVKEVLFFCGNRRRHELPDWLSNEKIAMHEMMVYETELAPKMIRGEYNGVLFFSPSAVQSYFSANLPSAETVLFAIGPTTGEELTKYTSGKILYSREPSAQKLIELVCNYFERKTF